MHDAWQEQRGDLNHYWLKNTFLLTRLKQFIGRLKQAAPNIDLLKEFAMRDWPEWPAKRTLILQLLDSAEDALSPRQLLEAPPLSFRGALGAEWLPDLVHELWLVRYPIRGAVCTGMAELVEADRHYCMLDHLLSHPEKLDLDRLRGELENFAAFEDALTRLSDVIHVLPHRILVV